MVRDTVCDCRCYQHLQIHPSLNSRGKKCAKNLVFRGRPIKHHVSGGHLLASEARKEPERTLGGGNKEGRKNPLPRGSERRWVDQ